MSAYHEHYHSRGGGHLYQGRFKSFPVEEEDYFLTLCRYVEANPLRAGTGGAGPGMAMERLMATGHAQIGDDGLVLSTWPVERPRNWTARVNARFGEAQGGAAVGCPLAAVRVRQPLTARGSGIKNGRNDRTRC